MQETRRNAVTLVLGGARSGKSHYAQQLGERAGRVVFIATAQAGDEEMRAKIDRHRAERPAYWRTVEEPRDLGAAIEQHAPAADLILVDCLTFFAANLLGSSDAGSYIDHLCDALKSHACGVVLVSNEVGSGVVPAYESGRRYRDLLGEINQRVAAVADDVVLMVAGLPLTLKGSSHAVRFDRSNQSDQFEVSR